MVGLSIIGLTILVTYGLCSAFGLFFGPTHNAIPFLFLGIGMKHVLIKKYENHTYRKSTYMRLVEVFYIFRGPCLIQLPNIRRSYLVGIDDMFVIMQSLDNLGPNERKANNIPQNIGQTMKHAGHNGVKTFLKSQFDILCASNDFKLYILTTFCGDHLKQLKFMNLFCKP